MNRRKKDHYNRSSNDELWQVGLKQGVNKTLFEPIDKTTYSVADECEAYWIQHYRELPGGVFNQSDPVRRRYINQVMIEMFCKHFDIPCDALLKRKEDFSDLTDLFDKMQDEVKIEKRQVDTGLFKPDSIINDAVRIFAQKYEEVKSKANAIDFEDMLIYSANILENSKDLCQFYRDKYPYVLVDEFQDLSPADFRLISQLSKNIFAVGDDDQAIYGFRGGDSKIMQTFYNRDDVSKYKVTRNYRSTATIVDHAKALIEYNKGCRIPKNLSAKNPRQFPIRVLETTPKMAEKTLLTEFTEPVCQTQLVQKHFPNLKNILLPKLESKTAILARTNAEVGKIEKMIEKLTPGVKKDLEVSNIHKAKGQEYDRVILIANTLDVWETDKPYNSLPTDQDDENEEQRVSDEGEERRVFYVAMTRAKYELIVLGRNCQFISEFQNVPPTKENLEAAFREELAVREPKLKIELDEASKIALAGLESKCTKESEEALEVVHRQYEPEFNRLRRVATENENEVKKMKAAFPQQLKSEQDTFLEGLIPVLDEFESQIKNLSAIAESNNGLDNLGVFTKRVRSPHTQLLDLLKTHQLKPIETVGEVFNLTYHEKTSLDVYSDEVPAGTIAREERRGYLLKNQVIRKAEVVVSRGPEFFPDGKLDWIVGRYLDRLTSEFGSRYQLNNVNEKSVRRAIVQYLTEQDDESVRKTHALACINERPDGSPADYCVGPEKTHLCTDDVFRGFWKRMWEVIEQSRNPSESQTKEAAAPVPSKIKQVQPSVDPPVTTHTEFTDGEIVKGVVVDVNRDEVMIDIGFKSEGYIPASEFDAGQNDLPTVQVGDEIDVYIVRREDSEGQIVLSKKIADQTLIWDEIATAYDTGAPVMGRITERIKGGLRVSVGSLRGFLPASQIELRPIQNLEQYVGQTLEMKIISLSKRRHNIVLSRRAWLEAELVQKRSEVLNTLEVGQQVTGVVKNITAFGAFVDLGGVDGLLHKSEMAWKRINHPSQVVSVGEEVEVKIIEFDRENGKISLSLKQMTSDPWENVEVKYSIGSKVSGVVVNIVDFGAFVQLEEEIVGLIHVSEMPLILNNVSPLDLLNENDELEVTVLKISKDARKISLGIEEKEVEVPPDELPSIVEIDTEIPKKTAETTVPTSIKETAEKTPISDEPAIVAEVEDSLLGKSTDSIISNPREEIVDTPSPSNQFSDILDSQIQNLKPETLATETLSERPEAYRNNTQKTRQKYHEVLNTQIRNLKPEVSETENRDNITQTTPLGTKVDRKTPADRTALTRSDSSAIMGRDTHQIKGQDFQGNEIGDTKKSLRYYLRQGRRFAVEKIKTIIFKKSNS